MDKPISQMTPNEWVRHNQEQRILDHHERDNSITAHNLRSLHQPSGGVAPQSSGQPYFTPGGMRDARAGVLAAIFAPVMYHVFKAAVARGATYPKAFLHAMDTLWVWKTWAFASLYWVVSGVCIYFWRGAEAMQGDPATGYTTGRDVSFQTMLLVLHAALLVPAILVPYCQHIDSSYLRRRALYNIVRPVHTVLGRIPWFVLQTTVLLPLLFIIQYRW